MVVLLAKKADPRDPGVPPLPPARAACPGWGMLSVGLAIAQNPVALVARRAHSRVSHRLELFHREQRFAQRRPGSLGQLPLSVCIGARSRRCQHGVELSCSFHKKEGEMDKSDTASTPGFPPMQGLKRQVCLTRPPRIPGRERIVSLR